MSDPKEKVKNKIIKNVEIYESINPVPTHVQELRDNLTGLVNSLISRIKEGKSSTKDLIAGIKCIKEVLAHEENSKFNLIKAIANLDNEKRNAIEKVISLTSGDTDIQKKANIKDLSERLWGN